MTITHLHPTHLFDKARRDGLSRQESEHLAAHLGACDRCAIEHACLVDVEQEFELAAPDFASADAVMLVLQGSRETTPPASRWRSLAVAAALPLLLSSTLVAALVMLADLNEKPTPVETPVAQQGNAPRPVDHVTAPPVAVVADATSNTAREVAPPRVEPAQRQARRPTESAADIFRAANDARRASEWRRALVLYDRLQRRFPGSEEEVTSRVVRARMLLRKLDAPGRALEGFESYLRGAPEGVLAEEARAGRALALQALGRNAEERGAWQDLLATSPNSVHATYARARLEALRP